MPATIAYRYLLVPVLMLLAGFGEVRGHGRLIEPPSRASAWRYGFKTPPNYNDHELYCGGYSRQHNRNLGKCGVCGDPWDIPVPRPHEYGGIYGQGVIVRSYSPGSIITIRVELTANHFGYFEFKLCPNYRETTQGCLDKHQLQLSTSTTSTTSTSKSNRFNKNKDLERFYPKDGNKVYEIRYKLPHDLSCPHCVLQWTYTAGNNWGACANGTEGVGCGPQETFRACADIKIQYSGDETTTTQIINENEDEFSHPYDGFKTLFVVGLSLFIVLLMITILYTYYYELGARIKGCLRRKKQTQDNCVRINVNGGIVVPPPPKHPAPVPPPRPPRGPRGPRAPRGDPRNTGTDQINHNESIA